MGVDERNRMINEIAEQEAARAPPEMMQEARDYWASWAKEEKETLARQDQGNE